MKTLLALAPLVCVSLALAAPPAPDAMVREITDDVLASMQGD